MVTVGKIQEWIDFSIGLATILAVICFVAWLLSHDYAWCLSTIVFLMVIWHHSFIETTLYRYAKKETESEKLVRESKEFLYF